MLGLPAVKAAVEAALTRLLRHSKGKVSPEDQREIRAAAKRMIKAATMEEVYRFDPTFQAISDWQAKRKGVTIHHKKAYGVKASARRRVLSAKSRKSVPKGSRVS
jgi:hypothetical protein